MSGPPPMNLTLTVESKAGTRTFHYTRGDVALRELRHWDEEPFTVRVRLTNQVATGRTLLVPAHRVPHTDGSGMVQLVPARGEPEYEDVLVWESVDTMPRWATAPARARERARRQAEAGRLLIDPNNITGIAGEGR